ncbi:unnamed protein product [Echinostoma caproni]|uniref:NXPE family member 3-like n=1 Tax=Echinostoma caproni TaxID=27848 RepID=A0A183AF02_9TREM|nr:unnamed protein product [Echinostoma caproni]
MRLSKEAARMLAIPNAGGSSVVSEVFSFAILARYLRANLHKMETEIDYFPKGGAMTDYVVRMRDPMRLAQSPMHLGVSVARLMTAPGQPYSVQEAERLLRKKLHGIAQSNRNCQGCWEQQILHVWSSSVVNTKLFKRAVKNLMNDPDRGAFGDIIILVTTVFQCPEIFSNRRDERCSENYSHQSHEWHLPEKRPRKICPDGPQSTLECTPIGSEFPRHNWKCRLVYFITKSFPSNLTEQTISLGDHQTGSSFNLLFGHL